MTCHAVTQCFAVCLLVSLLFRQKREGGHGGHSILRWNAFTVFTLGWWKPILKRLPVGDASLTEKRNNSGRSVSILLSATQQRCQHTLKPKGTLECNDWHATKNTCPTHTRPHTRLTCSNSLNSQNLVQWFYLKLSITQNEELSWHNQTSRDNINQNMRLHVAIAKNRYTMPVRDVVLDLWTSGWLFAPPPTDYPEKGGSGAASLSS